MSTHDEEVALLRRRFIDGLRELAAFYEEHPGMYLTGSAFTVSVCCSSREEFAAQSRLLGTFDKKVDDHWLNCNRKFGPITLNLFINREYVCTKVKVKKEIEVEEWQCPESVLKELDAVKPEEPKPA